jgi:hypothetical protein
MRLIIVPQYPSRLRYQEWWYDDFPQRLGGYFDDVVMLGANNLRQAESYPGGLFAPTSAAIWFETEQIREFMEMKIYPDDVFLVNDISYPGFFCNVFFHRPIPNKKMAICHATSINNYDYFWDSAQIKFPIETAHAELFDFVVVATRYHYDKLRWPKTIIKSLPFPQFRVAPQLKFNNVISVSRRTPQKCNAILEDFVENNGIDIVRKTCGTWEEYYRFVSSSKVMLITANEETYGYQVVDAVLNNCLPIAPNRFSYPELLPRKCLYDSKEEMLQKVLWGIQGKITIPKLLVEENAEHFYEDLAFLLKKDAQ